MSNSLFRFRFQAKLDSRGADLLRAASGMRISLGENFGREPGQGNIGTTVTLTLSKRRAPDSWEIEAWAHDPQGFDRKEVEGRRTSIREVLPRIADHWEEVG